MPALLEISAPGSLLEFLGFTQPDFQAEPLPKLKLINLKKYTNNHRIRLLKDILCEQKGSRVLLSHPNLSSEEHYIAFALGQNDPPVQYWDGIVLDILPQNFTFGTYPPGTPDFSSLADLRVFAEKSAVQKRFELDYQNIRGLLIPLRTDGKLRKLDYYFA